MKKADKKYISGVLDTLSLMFVKVTEQDLLLGCGYDLLWKYLDKYDLDLSVDSDGIFTTKKRRTKRSFFSRLINNKK